MKRILISLFVFSLSLELHAQRQRFVVQSDEREEERDADDQETTLHVAGKAKDPELVKADRSILARWPGTHEYLRCFFIDTAYVWKNLFTKSSMYVASALIPLYLGTRQANHAIHSKFYSPVEHKNVKQPPKFFKEIAVADGIVALPFIALNVYGWWFSRDPLEFRRVQVFNAGLVSTWGAKMILKELRHGDCYRPWHQDFSCEQQAPNGWPSGHSAMIAYLATYWGLEKGYTWGIPLGAFTLYAMAINVVANNHYLSQVFVGAGLGVLFGVSAHKTFQHIADNEHFSVGLGADYYGKPALRMAYDF